MEPPTPSPLSHPRNRPIPLQKVQCLAPESRKGPFLGSPYCRDANSPNLSQMLVADLWVAGDDNLMVQTLAWSSLPAGWVLVM